MDPSHLPPVPHHDTGDPSQSRQMDDAFRAAADGPALSQAQSAAEWRAQTDAEYDEAVAAADELLLQMYGPSSPGVAASVIHDDLPYNYITFEEQIFGSFSSYRGGGVPASEESSYRGGVPASSEEMQALYVPRWGETRSECAVCLQDLEVGEKLRMMPCFHSFHESCLFRWLAVNRICPLCRFVLQPSHH